MLLLSAGGTPPGYARPASPSDGVRAAAVFVFAPYTRNSPTNRQVFNNFIAPSITPGTIPIQKRRCIQAATVNAIYKAAYADNIVEVSQRGLNLVGSALKRGGVPLARDVLNAQAELMSAFKNLSDRRIIMQASYDFALCSGA